MIKKLFFNFLLTICFCKGFAHEGENLPRIQSLLPQLGTALNIEPFIPSDFVLVPSEVDKGNYFWIPDGLFEKYIADPKIKHRPFLQIIVQKIPDNKNSKNAVKEYISELKNHFPIDFSSLHWGSYEVAAIKMNPTLDDEYLAIVNLNQDERSLIMFRLVYHKKLDYGNGNKPGKEDLDFWNDFLNKTKVLR